MTHRLLIAAEFPGEWIAASPWPWPATLALALAAVAYALLNYYWERRSRRRLVKTALALVRAVVFLVLIALLYQWGRPQYETERPWLPVALDSSESMSVRDPVGDKDRRERIAQVAAKAGVRGRTRWDLAQSALIGWAEDWRTSDDRERDVSLYVMGKRLRPAAASLESLEPQPLTHPDPASRLTEAALELARQSRGRRTVGVVLVTDGVNNRGPAWSAISEMLASYGVPVFVLLTGGDALEPDVRIDELTVDEVLFRGEQTTVETRISHTNLAGKEVTAELYANGDESPQAAVPMTLSADAASQRVSLPLTIHRPGTATITVRVRGPGEERDTSNNKKSRVVTVRESRLNVLVIAGAPSYEYRFLRDLLERDAAARVGANGTGEPATPRPRRVMILQQAVASSATAVDAATEAPADADTAEAAGNPLGDAGGLDDFHVVVLLDPNPAGIPAEFWPRMIQFVADGGGLVLVGGPLYLPQNYSPEQLGPLLPFESAAFSPPDASATFLDPWLARLTPAGQSVGYLALGAPGAGGGGSVKYTDLPPLYWRQSLRRLKPAARTLLEVAPATPDTPAATAGGGEPLIMDSYFGRGRVIYHAFDEAWRWRFRRHLPRYERFWLQTLAYAGRIRRRQGDAQPTLTSDRSEYRIDEPVILRLTGDGAEAYETSQGVVTMVIRDEAGEMRRVAATLIPAPKRTYQGQAPSLPPGEYRATLPAKPTTDPPAEGDSAPNGEYSPSVMFTITPQAAEMAELSSPVDELRRVTRRTGGNLYRVEDVERMLASLPDAPAVRVRPMDPDPIWNQWWVAAGLLLLLAVEWAARRRLGLA